MCLLAKIGDHEYMAFFKPVHGSTDYSGRIDLRDSTFQTIPLDSLLGPIGSILVKDPAEADWHEMSIEDLKQLAKDSMAKSLVGLQSLSKQS